MIGRLPNRSDNTPSKGEKTNCISAKTTANRALHFAASVISPPRKSRISFGKTGMIKPIARMSRVTVTRMKIIAAGRDFMRVEHERNVVAAGGVNTRGEGNATAVGGGVFLFFSPPQTGAGVTQGKHTYAARHGRRPPPPPATGAPPPDRR